MAIETRILLDIFLILGILGVMAYLSEPSEWGRRRR